MRFRNVFFLSVWSVNSGVNGILCGVRIFMASDEGAQPQHESFGTCWGGCTSNRTIRPLYQYVVDYCHTIANTPLHCKKWVYNMLEVPSLGSAIVTTAPFIVGIHLVAGRQLIENKAAQNLIVSHVDTPISYKVGHISHLSSKDIPIISLLFKPWVVG